MQTFDRWQKVITYSALGAAAAMLIYQLLYTQVFIWELQRHRIVHLGFAFLVIILARLRKSRKAWPFELVLLFASLGVTLYFASQYLTLAKSEAFTPTPSLIAGVVAAVLVLIVTWQEYGKAFVIFALLSVAYMFLGRYVPGSLQAPPVPPRHILGWLGGDVASEWGVYGSILSLSANYLFLFIVFGSFLQAFGGLKFIRTAGTLVASRLRSGPAAVCVVTSGLLGTMTGSTVANITIIGSFTIPMMKSAGYTPEQAAGIETAASNGGQILPPVMGAAAFLMAGFVGIPYASICIAALLPAVVYYGTVLLYAELQARRLGLETKQVKVNIKEMLLESPPFIVPLAVLSILLANGYSLMFTGFWSIVACIVTGVISSLRGKAISRWNWRETAETIFDGVRMGSGMAVVCGVIGLIVAGIEMTGLAVILGHVLVGIAQGSLPLLLFFSAVVALILGMGLPTAGAYILTSVVLAPALITMGVPMLQAHLFILFYAVFNHLTPPVAVGALVASKISGAKYLGTCREALKAAFVALIIPVWFIYAPAINLKFESGLLLGMVQILSSIIVMASLQFMISQWCSSKLKLYETALLAGGVLLPLIFIFSTTPNYLLMITGAMLPIGGIVLNYRRSRALAGTKAA